MFAENNKSSYYLITRGSVLEINMRFTFVLLFLVLIVVSLADEQPAVQTADIPPSQVRGIFGPFFLQKIFGVQYTNSGKKGFVYFLNQDFSQHCQSV